MKNFTFNKKTLITAMVIFGLTLTTIAFAQNALIVPRGGTGTDYVPEGYFLVGNSINSLEATSSIFMNTDGSVSIGTLEISNEINPGPLTIYASSTSPEIRFSGDINTGINHGGADILSLYTGGEPVLTVDAGQQVLMGTTTGEGTAFLTIYDSAEAANVLIYGNSETTSDPDLFVLEVQGNARFKVDNYGKITGTAAGFYLNATNYWLPEDHIIRSDKVGIGMDAAEELDMTSTATTSIKVMSTGTGQGACLELEDVDGAGTTYCTVLDGTMTCGTGACN